jgi:homoserine O-acetyltransferase
MKGLGRVMSFVGSACGLLLLWFDATLAGAPAPAPTAAGPHTPEHQVANLGDFRFESGAVVKDFKVSYVTHGKLSRNKDNVILALQHFSGDHHDVDFLIGPGKALDPEKYFVVAPDFVGNARLRQDLTTGPTNSGLKMDFPRFTIRDSVAADHRLLKEYLGIDQVVLAIGASIGAMKAYQLAVSHPAFVKGIVPITGSPVTSPAVKTLIRRWTEIIQLDPGWYGGNYEINPTTGLITALMNFVPWLYTPQWFAANLAAPAQQQAWDQFWRALYTIHAPQDARDVYYQWQSWADFNVGESPGFKGDARAALRTVKAQALLIAARGDLLISPEEIALARNAIARSRVVDIDTSFGHLICCGADPNAVKIIDAEVAKFLASLR